MNYQFLKEENIVSIPEALLKNVLKNKKKTALIYFNRKFSYEEVYSFALKVKKILEDFSVNPSDRVAIWLINSPQFVFAYYGTLMNRSIVVPINFMSIANELKRKNVFEIKITEEIKAQILDSQPKVIIMMDFFWPIFAQIKDSLDWEPIVILTSPADFLPFPLKQLYPIKARREGKYVKKIAGTYRFLSLLKKEDYGFLKDFKIDKEEIAQLQYTGGTTGTPKAAILTHKNLIVNVLQCREHLKDFIKEGEIVLGALPFFHIYGLTVCLNATILSLSGSLILVPVFNPYDVLHLIEKYKVTVFPGVNRMYQVLCEIKEIKKYNLSSLKLCISGAGPIDQQICQKFNELTGCQIVEGYGLSETSPVISVALPKELHKKSIGRPLPETKVKIVDEKNNEVPIGKEGEIVVYGPQVMKGYWGKPEETEKVLRDGWLKTGDIGKIDEDGFLYFIDREKDLITVHGENIYPSKIEKIILEHKDVIEVAVVGIPDLRSGETPVAVLSILKSKDKNEIEKELIKLLKEKLPRIYLPSKFIFVDSLEPWKTAIGKVLKRKLKQWVIEQLKRIP
jgi:long-chain acyl-CoA synthetase